MASRRTLANRRSRAQTSRFIRRGRLLAAELVPAAATAGIAPTLAPRRASRERRPRIRRTTARRGDAARAGPDDEPGEPEPPKGRP